MTVLPDQVGPWPKGHPLSGSHIYFGTMRPDTSEKNLKNDSSKNEKTAESNASADQPQQSPTPSSISTPLPNTKPEVPSGNFENQVFIRKAAGMLTEDKPQSSTNQQSSTFTTTVRDSSGKKLFSMTERTPLSPLKSSSTPSSEPSQEREDSEPPPDKS